MGGGQGCIRREWGGGRDVLEESGGGGCWDVLEESGGGGQGCIRREWGGGGVLGPKSACPKMARPDFPNGKFRFFPKWSLWSGGGGSRGGVPPPMVYARLILPSGGGGGGLGCTREELLEDLPVVDLLFDGAAGHEAVHDDVLRLPDAPRALPGLQVRGGVPVRVVDED